MTSHHYLPTLSKINAKIVFNLHTSSKTIVHPTNTRSTEGSFLTKTRMSPNGTVSKNKVHFLYNKFLTH